MNGNRTVFTSDVYMVDMLLFSYYKQLQSVKVGWPLRNALHTFTKTVNLVYIN